jgi:hypothetical protein
MKNSLVTLMLLTMVSCGGSSSDAKKESTNNRYNPNSVPSEYKPKTQVIEFDLESSTKRVFLNSSFTEMKKITFSDDLSLERGLLKFITATDGSSARPNFSLSYENNNVLLSASFAGDFSSCSITEVNGRINAIVGSCIISAELILPRGHKIEGYLDNSLRTTRYFGQDIEEFMEDIMYTFGADNKLRAIRKFVATYTQVEDTLFMTSVQLGTLLNGIMTNHPKQQLKALELLQTYIVDRDNLKSIIDQNISSDYREDAYTLCNL